MKVQEAPRAHKAPLGEGRMVHIERDPEGCNVALCGRELHGIHADHLPLDCLVCEELARGMSK